MTVTTSTNKTQALGNGITTAFPYSFRIYSESDLIVTSTVIATGVDTELVLNTNYTVTGAGSYNGGNVVCSVAPASGTRLTIQRVLPVTQDTDLRNQGAYFAETHEDVFDKLTMVDQQQQETLDRSITFPASEDASTYGAIPASAVRANNLLGFDATGSLVAVAPAAQSATALQVLLATTTGASMVGTIQPDSGAIARTQQLKNNEYVTVTDFGTDGTALYTALLTGKVVHIPYSLTSFTLTAGQVATVLANFENIHPDAEITINLPSGVNTTTSGDILHVGPEAAKIRLIGATPVETTLSSIASVSGSAGAYSVVINVADGTGIAVGDTLKLFNVGPLPCLSGDNSAASILRARPLPNELYMPVVNLGNITAASGGGSASFDAVVGSLSDYLAVGDLLTIKGQTRPIATLDASSVTITGSWTNGVSGSRAYWVSRANSGTVGTAGSSTTVTGSSSLFLTEANIGDLLLVNGVTRKITNIANNTSMTVDLAITIAGGTTYSILTAAVLHEGAHEVTAVSSNQITVTNRSHTKPPVNAVTTGSVQAIKTVLKNTGTGDGLVCEQGASMPWIDRISFQGPGNSATPIGLAMNNRISAGIYGDVTQQGTSSVLLLGPDVAVLRWGRNAFLGHGCTLNARKVAFSGAFETGVWLMEGAQANLRSTVLSGSGSIGLMVNAGATVLFTEGRITGSNGDGLRRYDGATGYAEIPFFWGNLGMGYRVIGDGGWHVNEGVSACNTASGGRFEAANGEISRMFIAGNDRAGIEGVDLSDILAEEIWISGTSGTTGDGHGIYLLNSNCRAESAGISGNSGRDIYADEGSSAMAPNIFTEDVNALKLSEIIVSDGDLTSVTVAEGAVAYTDGVSPAPALTGVARVNEFAADAAVVWSGAGTAIGATKLNINGGTNFSFFKMASAVFDFPSIGAGLQQTTTVTVSGATTTGMTAIANTNSLPAGVAISAYISAANTVTVVVANNTAGAIDPGNATLTVIVLGAG